jgi:hypothetical protein
MSYPSEDGNSTSRWKKLSWPCPETKPCYLVSQALPNTTMNIKSPSTPPYTHILFFGTVEIITFRVGQAFLYGPEAAN